VEALREATMDQQVVVDPAIARRHAAAERLIARSTKWSAAAGILPVPGLDLVALAAVQGKMVAKLGKLYGQKPSSELAQGVVAVLLGSLEPMMLASAVGSSIKAVPIWGSLVGGAAMAGFSSASTYAIGRIFIRHFERGGSLETFNADDAKEDLKTEFTKASAKA
jgi:uncharacterized protein (DUF697 family)